MLKSFFIIAFATLSLSPLVIPKIESSAAQLSTPLPPDTGESAVQTLANVLAAPAPITAAEPTAAPDETKKAPAVLAPTAPSRLIIPSIALDDSIAKVGINDKGEMDVPAGSTSDVGWYEGGTVPGLVGSAVLDAHVFAAFSRLQNIKVSEDIYVKTDSGQILHFVVRETKTYALADVPADILFNRADTERLNLITCAGKLTADHTTYDHRLVVYATLVHE